MRIIFNRIHALYRRRRWPALLLVGGLFLMTALPAQACKCIPMDESISKAAVEEAEIIAFGEIVSILQNMDSQSFDPIEGAPSENPNLALISIDVFTYYKGNTEEKNIALYIDTQTSCGYRIAPGDPFFVFASRYKDELMQNGICGLPAQKYWPEKLSD